MRFSQPDLKDAYLIDIKKIEDERGFFARSWDTKIFEENNLEYRIVQTNISFNKLKGTLRGLHYQIYPYEESKVVRCTRGKIYDVIIDLRQRSQTYKKWESFILSEDNYKMLYVPKGFAHGFITLEDETEVTYHVSEFYMPKYEHGIRWDDPTFNIKWPIAEKILSKKDMSWKKFSENED